MPKEYKFGPISFRLNPDAIKEELISFVPYNRTLRHIYNNPEGDIRETAKIAASETPILGSLLSGEPVDAAKEAILFGMPIKAKTKAEIKKLPADTKFKYNQGSNTITYYSPKTKEQGIIEETGLTKESKRPKDMYGVMDRVNNDRIDLGEMLNSIDQTNNLLKLNGKRKFDIDDPHGKLTFKDKAPDNPYDLDRLTDNKFLNTIEGKVLNEAQDLVDRYNGGLRNYPDKYSSLQWRESNYNKANIASNNLKKGEQLVFDPKMAEVMIKKGNDYYYIVPDEINGTIERFYTNDKPNTVPYSDVNFPRDLLQYKQDVNLYNANRGFEDNFINIDPNNPTKWYSDVLDARDEFINSVHGPFLEDLLKLYR